MYVHVYVHIGTQGKNAKFKVRKCEVAKSSSTKVRLNNTMMLYSWEGECSLDEVLCQVKYGGIVIILIIDYYIKKWNFN